MTLSLKKNVVILGATGSIGDSTLSVIRRHPDRFNVFAISAHSNIKKMVDLCHLHQPDFALLSNIEKYDELKSLFKQQNITTKIVCGLNDISKFCQMTDVDMVVAGIVGSAGMQPVLAAVSSGKDLLLANKEALVVAGELVMKAAAMNRSNIIPLDSEHNAIYQCLSDDYRTGETPKNIDKIILTASGGPFWNLDSSQFSKITPEQACDHPNWNMGRKISVDSATLMNKGLEIIEAHWLFNIASEKIDVHVHPQSIVHSMVCYKDGSVLAQLGEPDMRIPIAYGLGLRERISSGSKIVNLLDKGRLDFFLPDYEKFPSLLLAKETIKTGGTASLILNASNEISVAAFLDKKIGFNQIYQVNQEVMETTPVQPVESLEQLLDLDLKIRKTAIKAVNQYA